MSIQRQQYSFSLTGDRIIDLETARSQYKLIDIINLGIDKALESIPKPNKAMIKKAKELVR